MLRAQPDSPKLTVQISTLVSEKFLWIKITPLPSYHFYYLDPGEMGVPPEVQWNETDDSVNISPLQYPLPKRFKTGTLHCIGYDHAVWLRAPYHKKNEITPERITGQLSWLSCNEDLCLPESTTILFDLTQVEAPPTSQPWPQPTPKTWQSQIQKKPKALIITLSTSQKTSLLPEILDVFTTQKNIQDPTQPIVSEKKSAHETSITIPLSEYTSPKSFPSEWIISTSQGGFILPAQRTID